MACVLLKLAAVMPIFGMFDSNQAFKYNPWDFARASFHQNQYMQYQVTAPERISTAPCDLQPMPSHSTW